MRAYVVWQSQPMVAGPSFSSEFPDPRSRVPRAQRPCDAVPGGRLGPQSSDQPRRKRQPACRLSGLQSNRFGKGARPSNRWNRVLD